jgi:hypothetical protein
MEAIALDDAAQDGVAAASSIAVRASTLEGRGVHAPACLLLESC